MKNPLVSIIIPVYNGTNYMREAIDSALNQTYANCEVIVVNDGSTDETEEVALSYGDRIRYFVKENGGVSTALNVGIQNMAGEYFQYLPHDDILHCDKIEKQIAAIQKTGNPKTICWTGWNMLSQKTGEVKEVLIPYRYNDPELYTRGAFPVYVSIISTVSVLLHRSYFETEGLFNEALWTSQDYDMWFRTFKDNRTVYLEEPLLDYRWHEEQGTQADAKFTENCMALAERMYQELPEESVRKIFGNRYRFLYYNLEHSREAGWRRFHEKLRQELERMEEPVEVENECRQLRNKLRHGDGQKLVLYCAGRNAVRLQRELYQRGIEVDALCDSDPAKIGTCINGVFCVPLEKMGTEDVIIVTKDYPEELVELLREKGYRNVTSYREIGSRVYYTMPYKKRILEGK